MVNRGCTAAADSNDSTRLTRRVTQSRECNATIHVRTENYKPDIAARSGVLDGGEKSQSLMARNGRSTIR